MLSSNLLAIVILFNLIAYLTFSFYYDFVKTYSKHELEVVRTEKPPAWNNSIDLFFTLIPTLLIWILFFYLPIFFFFVTNSYMIYTIFAETNLDIGFIQGFGMILLCLGTLIAFLGRKERGQYSKSWGIPTKLITTGIFNYIRHPLYTSYFLYFFGFFLIFSNIITAFLLTGIFGYYRSAKYEELILLEAFGEEWAKYYATTGRFFPKIW